MTSDLEQSFLEDLISLVRTSEALCICIDGHRSIRQSHSHAGIVSIEWDDEGMYPAIGVPGDKSSLVPTARPSVLRLLTDYISL